MVWLYFCIMLILRNEVVLSIFNFGIISVRNRRKLAIRDKDHRWRHQASWQIDTKQIQLLEKIEDTLPERMTLWYIF